MRLYPRLPLPRAHAIAASFEGKTLPEIRSIPVPDPNGYSFAPTGGARTSLDELRSLRDGLERIADVAGWPEPSLNGRQQFDREALVLLGTQSLVASEMLRADTWAWLATVLVPHLVLWRFEGSRGAARSSRLAGAVQRNALGRLWLRAWTLDLGDAIPDRWRLATGLSEDAAVAIMERTSLSGDHRSARAIATEWLSDRMLQVEDREALLRDVAKRLRVLVTICELSVLSDAQLVAVVGTAFDNSLAARAQRAYLVS